MIGWHSTPEIHLLKAIGFDNSARNPIGYGSLFRPVLKLQNKPVQQNVVFNLWKRNVRHVKTIGTLEFLARPGVPGECMRERLRR